MPRRADRLDQGAQDTRNAHSTSRRRGNRPGGLTCGSPEPLRHSAGQARTWAARWLPRVSFRFLERLPRPGQEAGFALGSPPQQPAHPRAGPPPSPPTAFLAAPPPTAMPYSYCQLRAGVQFMSPTSLFSCTVLKASLGTQQRPLCPARKFLFCV